MTNKSLIISYPRMGNYHILLEKTFKILFPQADVITPPNMTAKTLEIGSRHSPENVCSPFKYNIGNFVEALEQGANVLAQTGLGCIFGYYGELQEQILKDLGYEFDFLCFSQGKVARDKAFDTYRKLGGKASFPALTEAFVYTLIGINVIDKFEYRMRKNMTCEVQIGAHAKLHKMFLDELQEASLKSAHAIWKHYSRALDNIELTEQRPLRIGLVGELYTLMEPFSNFNLERELFEAGCSVSRRMNASFLALPQKKKSLRDTGGYLNHLPGANGADTVAQTINYAKKGYDGVIHMKSFGCTPEINVMPVLDNIGRDMNIPVLSLSFDTHTGEAGLQTRLEAFVDMLKMRKEGGAIC